MENTKILILDSDVNTAALLREHICALGYSKVYLSSNKEILPDLTKSIFFQYLFIDNKLIDDQTKILLIRFASEHPEARLVLLHSGYENQVKNRIKGMRFDYLICKPFDFVLIPKIFKLEYTGERHARA